MVHEKDVNYCHTWEFWVLLTRISGCIVVATPPATVCGVRGVGFVEI